MKRHFKKKHGDITVLMYALQARAKVHADALGHTLGSWHPAKKKHGVAAQKAICVCCGEIVFILPYHCHDKVNPQVPAITGPVLSLKCAIEGDIVR